MPRKKALSLCVLVLLAAAWLRVIRLADLPPGWRDDEVVETTVHATLVLTGERPLYFTQAEGHEPLYHYLSAGWMALLGRSLFAVRLLSAFLGVLSLAALYRLADRLFGSPVALLAIAALALSFWGLMYARFKLRHVSTLLPMLLAFDFFWRALLPAGRRRREPPWLPAGLAGAWLAVSLYTYFAARVLPAILLAFAAYLAIFHPALFRRSARPLALALGVATLLTLPLALAILSAGGSEARLAVVGAPLRDLLHGDPAYALRNTRDTLAMFAVTGDPEFLYNIPHRPVFEWLGAGLLAAGVLLCLWQWRQPRYSFVLVWLLAGLAPAFLSTPAASLGHTIVAQPAAYLLPALAIGGVGGWIRCSILTSRERTERDVARQAGKSRTYAALALAAVFLAITAARDLHDYFARWPALPEVRHLYRADLHAAAAALQALPPGSDLALASASLHPADVLAIELEAAGQAPQVRLFNPERAWLLPERDVPVLLREFAPAGAAFGVGAPTGPFALQSTGLRAGWEPEVPAEALFANGWALQGYTLDAEGEGPGVQLLTYWRVDASFVPPPRRPVEVLSGTPLPLRFFSHVIDPDGNLLAGDDRLDVDPATLQPGDSFLQLFHIPLPADLPAGQYSVQVGVYDPASGVRVPLASGGDRFVLTQFTVQP